MFTPTPAQQRWLETFIAEVEGFAGTVHVQREGDLHLVAALNIPPPVIQIVEHVAHGKGMAGEAQVRKAPVQTCNLQTDASGTIKPGARAVDAQAGIALPVLGADGELRAVVGVAWTREGEISADDERRLMALAAQVP